MRGINAWWLVLLASIFLISSPEAAWSRDCGDTSGPGGTDVPCSCGDQVTTSTRLDATDPVLSTVCPDHGLWIFNLHGPLVLEINGTIRGSGLGIGINVNGSSFVTVTRGRITGFVRGVYASDNHDVTFSRLDVFGNSGDGFDLDENWGNTIVERSTVHSNGGDGIWLGNQSSALRNRVADNAGWGIMSKSDGGEGPGELTARNVVVRNGLGGILVQCLRCTVEKNLVLHNGGFGIRDTSWDEKDLGENIFTGNICSGNGFVDSDPPGLCR